MRCSRKSTTWRASAAALAAAAMLAAAPSMTAASGAAPPCAGDAAIAAVVRATLGNDARIAVETSVCALPAGAAPNDAAAEPGARIGRPTRFRLLQGGRYIGYAIATPHAAVPHLRLARDVAPGAVLTAGDLRAVTGDIAGAPLEAMPAGTEAIGQRVSRRLAAGDLVTADLLGRPLAVRSGDRVTVRTIVDGVEARATATAQQSGRPGDVIWLINPDSRKRLRGRIVGEADVEVTHGS